MKSLIYLFVISFFLICDALAEINSKGTNVRNYDFREIEISLIKESASQGSEYGVTMISYGGDKQTESYYDVAQSFSCEGIVKALFRAKIDSGESVDVYFNGYKYENTANAERLREIIRFGIDNELHLSFDGSRI